VGGPLLGERHNARNKSPTSDDAPQSTRVSFQPLITPLIGVCKNTMSATAARPERFVLLPHDRYIQVLAYKTGKIVANFILSPENSSVKIDSLCLATYPARPHNVLDILDTTPAESGINKIQEEDYEDNVLVVGCSDGTVRELTLLVLLPNFVKLQKELCVSSDCGDFELAGPTYGPRRVFQVTQGKRLSHITAPSCVSRAEYGILVYALAESKSNKNEEISVSVLRFLFPPFYNNSIVEGRGKKINLLSKEASTRIHKVGKFHSIEKNLPFTLASVVRDRSQDVSSSTNEYFLQQSIFLVVARPSALLIYCERLSDTTLDGSVKPKKFVSVSFGFLSKNPLTSMAISVNNSDIACGFQKGDIIVKTNILTLVDEYHTALEKYEKQKDSKGGKSKPDHPAKHLINARVHWHSHPVISLCYDRNSPLTDPILYSGGEESVLVTWQLSRGINRPSDVLPRLAQRGISHIICPGRADSSYNMNDSILVHCEDNTLQMRETHSKGLIWKVLGIAAIAGSDGASVAGDPHSATSSSPYLILNGLPDAPGMMQWYDTREQQVVGTLEIAPYNRVSSMDRNETTPMPAPSVAHFSMTRSGGDLITIDIAPTENKYVGARGKYGTAEEEEFGCVSTVKFWSWNLAAGSRSRGAGSRKPYDLVAAMAHPHGSGNLVSAAALSTHGNYACTVSNDERAFRVWQKVEVGREEGDEATGRRLPAWVCQYKVSTPAGYSNYKTGKYAVAFSLDASLVAICYGHMITLWDRENMTLLTCLVHLNGEDAVEYIEFVENDMLLCKSPDGLSLLSPFRQQQRAVGWSWIASDMPGESVSCAQILASHNIVAVSIYKEAKNTSRIVLLDLKTGTPLKKKAAVVIEKVHGRVCSIGQPGTPVKKVESNWVDAENDTSSTKETPLALHVLTSDGMLLSLREESRSVDKAVDVQTMLGSSAFGSIPRLPNTTFATTSEPVRKRRRITAPTSIPQNYPQDKKLAMSSFGSILEESGTAVTLPTSELPTLSGDFARAFVGRNLLRK